MSGKTDRKNDKGWRGQKKKEAEQHKDIAASVSCLAGNNLADNILLCANGRLDCCVQELQAQAGNIGKCVEWN